MGDILPHACTAWMLPLLLLHPLSFFSGCRMTTYENIELQEISPEPLVPPPTPVDNSSDSTPPHIFVNTEPPVPTEYVPMDRGTITVAPTPPIEIPQQYLTPPHPTENPSRSAQTVPPPITRTPRRAISQPHRAPQRSRPIQYAPPFRRRSYLAPPSQTSSTQFEHCLLLMAFLLGICLFTFIVSITIYIMFKLA